MSFITQLKAGDTFDGLGSEREQDSRNVEIKNEKLEWLLRGFSWVFEEWKENEQGETKHLAQRVLSLYPYALRARDIRQLSVALQQYDPGSEYEGNPDSFCESTGFYLNECIQRCNDKRIGLDLSGYSNLPDFIGQKNTGKHVIVRGDIGGYVGDGMIDGRIDVYGEVCANIGHEMQGGKIVLHQNGGEGIGASMKGGLIIVKGSVGAEIGDNMAGGEIRVYGGTEQYLRGWLTQFDPKITGGNIFYRNKPVVINGRLVK